MSRRGARQEASSAAGTGRTIRLDLKNAGEVRTAAEDPWLTDLEINPLMLLKEGHGVRAVDVRAIRQS